MNKPKTICFYLPQYYQFKENDEWWGEGFTEWTNVKKSISLFKNHYQPVIPQNNNYYCLTDPEVYKWQIEMAKGHGVYGFCFYQYYFGDNRYIMEKPLELFLNHSELDIPFCLSWANHNWTRSWVGGEKEILMEVKYLGNEDYKNYFNYLKKFFCDKRYILVNNKPLFVIYKPDSIPDLSRFKALFETMCKEIGFDGIFLVSQEADCALNYSKYPEIDKAIMYEPNYSFSVIQNSLRKGRVLSALNISRRFTIELVINKIKKTLDSCVTRGKIFKNMGLQKFSYDAIWNMILNRKNENKAYRGALVGFDSTPRRGRKGIVFIKNKPEKFKNYYDQLINHLENEEFVFITAWNEWGEGAYLEPDEKHGDSYLEGVKNAYER